MKIEFPRGLFDTTLVKIASPKLAKKSRKAQGTKENEAWNYKRATAFKI